LSVTSLEATAMHSGALTHILLG